MRLVQIANGTERRVAVVEEPELLLLEQDVTSTYALALRALEGQMALTELVLSLRGGERVRYDAVYDGTSEWRLLAPIDVPGDLQKVLVTGTGLTHLGSARERQAMHAAAGTVAEEVDESKMTDSMRMFAWGQQGGRPAAGEIGIAPEWFYKGDGSVVRGPGEPLTIPGHAEDGGEEAEVATVYLIAADGVPHRIGMTTGNEFSDHVFERRNYLNLAGSKLRDCSIGPELVIGEPFENVPGTARAARRRDRVAEADSHRRGEHGAQPPKHGTPPLQVRWPSAGGHGARALSGCGRAVVRQRRAADGRRCSGDRVRGLRAGAAQPRASGSSDDRAGGCEGNALTRGSERRTRWRRE